MIKAKFNLSRYEELLNYVKTTDRKLLDMTLLKEFWDIQLTVQNQIFYERRIDYFDLIQQYLDKKIDSYIFRSKFMKLQREDLEKSKKILNNFEKLSNFWFELNSDDFYSTLDPISETCICAIEHDGPDELPSPEEYYNSVKKAFLKLQKYLV